MTDDFDFEYGATGAAEAFANLRSGGGRGLPYLSMKDGEVEILRFVNDAYAADGRVAWITIDQHSMVPTKPAPAGYSGNWPRVMSAVCRHAKAFRGKFADCFICDNMKKADGKSYSPSPRTWAIACRREQVVENGQVIGIRDKTREYDEMKDGKPTGNKVTVKDLVIVNLGYKNFFSIMEGFAGAYQTVLDRDYHVKRAGSDQNTVYHIAPLDKINLADGRVYDLREADIFARYAVGDGDTAQVPDLRKIVADRASDDYYGRFFDTRVSNASPTDGGNAGGGQAAPPAPSAPATDVDDDAQMAELRARVKGSGGQAPAAAEPEPAAATSGMQAL